jgi:hypothetical protein
MAWTYDASDLVTSTASGRLNVVRVLIGDTDTNNQMVQDEEINLALSEVGDNVYFAGSYVADTLAAKYSNKVDTKLDGALSATYSQLSEQYRLLSARLKQQGHRYSGSTLGISVGGVKVSDINAARNDTNRVSPSFRIDRFRYPGGDYDISDYTEE